MPTTSMFELDAVLKTVATGGAAIGMFAALRLQRRRGEHVKADRLLGLLVFLCAANVAHGIIDFRPTMSVSLILEPLQFFLPIGLAWYLRALRGRQVVRAVDGVFFALTLGFIAASYAPGVLDVRLSSGISVFSLVMWLSISVSSMLLLLPIARDTHKYRRELQDEHSNLEGIDPGWLQGMLLMVAALFAVYALLAVLMLHAPAGLKQRPILAALMTILTVYLSWMSLGRRRTTVRVHRGDREQPRERYGEEPEEVVRKRAAELLGVVERRKLFLDPELCLDDLAVAAGLSRHQASEALNRGLGTSFFDLVNGYRIEEFKRLCAEPDRRNEKIMTLAFEAGFNSKPSFNLVFKKTTGRTPSEYRTSAEIESRPID